MIGDIFILWNNERHCNLNKWWGMDKGKIVAVVTGAISILIAIAYLVIVQLIDFRGEMVPAPISQLSLGSYQIVIMSDQFTKPLLNSHY